MSYIPFAPNNQYDLKPNAYASVGGNVTNQQTVSQYEFYKPQELVQLFMRHADRPSMRLLLKAMGFKRGVAAPTTGHFEAPWYKSLVTVGSVVTPAVNPGDPAIIALDAGDMFNPNDTVNGVAAFSSYPVVGNILVLQDGIRVRVNAKNTTVNPHRLTLSPIVATDNIATSLTVGAAYFIATNSHTEGSGLPEGRTARTIRYTNKFQIVKESASSTGTNLTDQTYWQFKDKAGSNFTFISWQTMRRFEDECDGALFWGKVDTNNQVFEPNTGIDQNVTGTEGLDAFATSFGNTNTYTIGSYTMADFDSLGFYYEQQRLGTRDLMCWQGAQIRTDIENTLVDLLNADMAALTATKAQDFFFGDGTFSNMADLGGDQPSTAAKLAVDIGFRAVKKGGFTFCFYTLHILNEYMGAGAPGYDYPYIQYIMPVGYSKNRDTGTTTPTFGYEYKELNGVSRENKVGYFSGVGANMGDEAVVSGNDIRTFGLLSETAFHGTCANHVTVQSPTP